MDLFSDGLVTITFGDGPLGFRVGESEEGFPIISGFTEKDDCTYFPIYVGNLSSPQLRSMRDVCQLAIESSM